MKELTEIGEKVNDSINAVWKLGLNIEELGKLEEYINYQETMLPLVDPSFIQQGGFKLLDQAKKRIELLKPIILLKQEEAE